jgi:heme/copper-type cytochrome/quinol oxidase subunit 2
MFPNENFDKKLIDKIREEKISPKPRWQFLLKNWAIWTSGILALLVGALFVSVIIYFSRYSDWEVMEQVSSSPLEFIFLTLPYFWLVSLALFIFIVYYNIKHTKNGYRYPIWIIVSVSIFSSILLGSFFSYLNFDEKFDGFLGKNAPFYDQLMNSHISFWSQPEQGRISGLVISEPGQGRLTLVDRSNEEWDITIDSRHERIPENIPLNGLPMKAIGKQTGDHQFLASKLLPPKPGKEFFARFKDNKGRRPLPFAPDGQILPGMPEIGQTRCGGLEGFNSPFEKYPSIRAYVIKGLSDDKEAALDLAGRDPGFIKALELLGVDIKTLK